MSYLLRLLATVACTRNKAHYDTKNPKALYEYSHNLYFYDFINIKIASKGRKAHRIEFLHNII